MFVTLMASVISGIILGAPFGVSGALAADAILTHNQRLVRNIVIASVSGEAILAFLIACFTKPINSFVVQYQAVFFALTGIIAIGMGIISLVSTYRNQRGMGSETPGRVKWLLLHTGPPLAAFTSNLIHPGNVLAFIFTIAVLTAHIPAFEHYHFLFGPGILLGSSAIFTICAIVFWKNRKKADKFVHYFRYALGGVMCLIGMYLILGKSI